MKNLIQKIANYFSSKYYICSKREKDSFYFCIEKSFFLPKDVIYLSNNGYNSWNEAEDVLKNLFNLERKSI
jgi:hypothetical protein